jgi:hypothetical protein
MSLIKAALYGAAAGPGEPQTGYGESGHSDPVWSSQRRSNAKFNI